MIFLTVGTQLGFDRLVKIVDEAAPKIKHKIFAQIGNSSYIPKNFEFVKNLELAEFEKHFSSADLIVSHAGMGTIISSLVESKPIWVCPRRFSLKEHRNDHQVHTVNKFKSFSGFSTFEDVSELISLVEAMDFDSRKISKVSDFAEVKMLDRLEKIISD